MRQRFWDLSENIGKLKESTVSSKRILLSVFLLLVPLGPSKAATGAELRQVGKALDGALTADKADSYVLQLKAGDMVETNVVTARNET